MCAGSAQSYNVENEMIYNPIPRYVDMNIEVYLFQECECVL